MDSLQAVNARTRRAYNLAAETYHELFCGEMQQKEYDRKLLDRFAGSLRGGALVCDAGCGPSGHIGRYVFDKGVQVVGLDISDRCVELARQHNRDMPFVQGDIGELPFADRSVDGIIAYYSIIDTPKRCVARLFAGFHRVLRPGGRLLVAVKAGENEGYLTELLGIETEIYMSLFTQDEIRAYLQQAGLTLEWLDQRSPYEWEINAERVFAIGRRP